MSYAGRKLPMQHHLSFSPPEEVDRVAGRPSAARSLHSASCGASASGGELATRATDATSLRLEDLDSVAYAGTAQMNP